MPKIWKNPGKEGRPQRILATMVLIPIGFFLVYLWAGFLHPDPWFLAGRGVASRIMYHYFPLVVLPALFFLTGAILLLRNRTLARHLQFMFLAVIFLFLLIYPLADILWYLRGRQKSQTMVALYHPYLQLKPRLPQESDLPPSGSGHVIFCLGGSTTEMKDSRGKGWPERLQSELRDMTGDDSIWVCNLGRQWYTTLHTLINYQTNLRSYHPDLLIVMHNINDLLQNADFSYFSRGPFRADYGHFYGPSAQLPDQYGLFGHHWENLVRCWYHRPREMVNQDSFPGLTSFTRNLRNLLELARLDSTKVILLSQPTLLTEDMNNQARDACVMVKREAVGPDKQWSFETAICGMRQYNTRIGEIAREEGVLFIDLEKAIPKNLTWFFDEVHYRDTTFNLIGTTLAREIARTGILHSLKAP